MKTNLPRIRTLAGLALLTASGLALLVGCAGHPRTPALSGFLTHYCTLDKVDDTTWRYIDNSRLATYNRFRITDVRVLANYFNGKELSDETKQKVTDYMRSAIVNALGDRYPVGVYSGPDVADIRVAITEAYMTENHLGLTIEGEILDSTSGYQVAAVVRTQLSEPYYSDYFDAPAAREMMRMWAQRLRDAIDVAHKR